MAGETRHWTCAEKVSEQKEHHSTPSNVYNCPGSGVPGRLQVLIKNATNLKCQINVYVQVTAVDDQEFKV